MKQSNFSEQLALRWLLGLHQGRLETSDRISGRDINAKIPVLTSSIKLELALISHTKFRILGPTWKSVHKIRSHVKASSGKFPLLPLKIRSRSFQFFSTEISVLASSLEMLQRKVRSRHSNACQWVSFGTRILLLRSKITLHDCRIFSTKFRILAQSLGFLQQKPLS